jgi:hypothetical protein
MQWIESDWKFQIQDGNELTPILIPLFGCVWNLLMESKGVSNSNFCLDVQTTEFDVLSSLDNMNLSSCMKNSMYILEYLYIILTYSNIKIIETRSEN